MTPAELATLVQLVKTAQAGDYISQRELILAYQPRITGFVASIVGKRDIVEDLTQLVFIKVVRSLSSLKNPEQFESWLFRLTRNKCIDYLRREKLRNIFIPYNHTHAEVAEAPIGVGSEELDALYHALEQLNPKDRALLGLAQQGYSQVEIAKTLNTTVAAIKARLHRARLSLREHYLSRTQD